MKIPPISNLEIVFACIVALWMIYSICVLRLMKKDFNARDKSKLGKTDNNVNTVEQAH